MDCYRRETLLVRFGPDTPLPDVLVNSRTASGIHAETLFTDGVMLTLAS